MSSRASNPLLVGGLQIAEQAFKRLLIGIVVFPAAKIADVPRPMNISIPARVTLHNGLVNSDREEYGSLLSRLLRKGRFNLFLTHGLPRSAWTG